jgi:hypothetical protein
MKLLMENWRQYLTESERAEKYYSELERLLGPRRAPLTWGTEDEYKDAHRRIGKQLWDKHVDRDFLNTLTLVHWTTSGNPERYYSSEKNGETSAEAYAPNEELKQRFDIAGPGVGLQIEGWITLASNVNMMSGHGYEPEERHQASGYVKPGLDDSNFRGRALVFDAETFRPPRSGNNEFIVDNWKPVAVVINGGTQNKLFPTAATFALEHNLPAIDENRDEQEWNRFKSALAKINNIRTNIRDAEIEDVAAAVGMKYGFYSLGYKALMKLSDWSAGTSAETRPSGFLPRPRRTKR